MGPLLFGKGPGGETLLPTYEWFLKTWGLKEMVMRHSFMLVEEVFEMLGSTLFLYLFLGNAGFLFSERWMVLGTGASRLMPESQ